MTTRTLGVGSVIYLICILGYLLLLGAIAVWKSRAVRDQSDFAVAGRSLSPWIMVCTMLAVWIGTGSIVGNAEQTYETGLAATILPVGTFLGMLLLATIAKRARNIEASTVPEILERRFGTTTRNLSMISLILAYLVIVSYQFNAGGAVLEVIVGNRPAIEISTDTPLSRRSLQRGEIRFQSTDGGAETIRLEFQSTSNPDDLVSVQLGDRSSRAKPQERIVLSRTQLKSPHYALVAPPERGRLLLVRPILTAQVATMIAAGFIICYAAMAGLLSLAWMDLVTGTIIMITLVISFPVYWLRAGGLEGIEAGFLADDRATHLSFWGVYSPIQLVNYLLPVFLLVLGDANQYQRIFASRSARGARTAVLLMVVIAFAIEVLIIGCAWLASSMTPDPENGKYILIYAARHYLPLPLGCLFMVTVVAIIISTADSFLHVPATSAVNDLYLKYVHPTASQKHIVAVSRAFVIVFGMIAYVVSLMFAESTGFFEKALYAFTIYGASITPSLVAALIWTRATTPAAIASIVGGAGVTLLWNEAPFVRDRLPSSMTEVDAVLPAITVSVSLLIVISLLTRPRPAR